MKALLAGFVTGYMVALCWTFLGAFFLARSRRTILWLRRAIPPQIPAIALTVPLSLIFPLLLTALGLMLGLIYWRTAEGAPGALGSPHLPFTLAVALPPLALAALLSLWRRGLLWPALSMALPFAALFGWVLPFLAER